MSTRSDVLQGAIDVLYSRWQETAPTVPFLAFVTDAPLGEFAPPIQCEIRDWIRERAAADGIEYRG